MLAGGFGLGDNLEDTTRYVHPYSSIDLVVWSKSWQYFLFGVQNVHTIVFEVLCRDSGEEAGYSR